MGTICGFACLLLRTPLPRAQENRNTFLQPADRRAQGERPRKTHGTSGFSGTLFTLYRMRMKMFCPGRCFSSTWAARQEEVFMLRSIIKDSLPCSTSRVLHEAQQWASKNCSFFHSNIILTMKFVFLSHSNIEKIKTKAIMTCFAVEHIPYNDLKMKDLKNNCGFVWRGIFAAMLKVSTGKNWKQEQGSLQSLFCYRPSAVGVASKKPQYCSYEDDKNKKTTKHLKGFMEDHILDFIFPVFLGRTTKSCTAVMHWNWADTRHVWRHIRVQIFKFYHSTEPRHWIFS